MTACARLTMGLAVSALSALALSSTASAAPADPAVDTTPPQVNINGGLLFSVGSVLSTNSNAATLPARVNWKASDDVGVSSQVGYFSDSSTSTTINMGAARRTFLLPQVGVSGGYASAEVHAFDAAGNEAYDYESFSNELVQQGQFTLSAGWTTASCNCWSNGSVVTAKRAGASAQYQFNGNSIALVGNYAPNRGRVDVYLDGIFQRTVSTLGETSNRSVIFEKRYKTQGTHTVKMVVNSGRVDLDALVVQR